MNFIKFNLTLTGFLLVLLYFQMPFYNEWLYGKVINVNNNMFFQMEHMDTTYRKAYRFGGSYLAYQDMKSKLEKFGSVTLLLPPNDYLKALGMNDISMCEPAEFYYFTGINSVWANSPDVGRANWAVVALKGKGLSLKKIRSRGDLDTMINMYKPFIK